MPRIAQIKTIGDQIWVKIDDDLYNKSSSITIWTDEDIKRHDWDITRLIMDSLKEIIEANYPNPYK